MKPGELREELERMCAESGVTLELQSGGKHRKIVIAGRLAGILPRTGSDRGRGHLNILAQARRVIREVRP